MLNSKKIFYNSIESCILNNGWSSNFFSFGRGVRQRCPLSPYLFILSVETLANAIRKNKDIAGISVNKNQIKLIQYADNTTLVLDGSEKPLTAFFQIYKLSWCLFFLELRHADDVYTHNRGGGGQILERGHMNPSYINTFLQARSDLTFKLSNAAPQYQTSNGGPWNAYERKLADYAKEVCARRYGGTLYVYTGTALSYVPGHEPAAKVSDYITKPPFIPQVSQSMKR